jgi:hypothetical protein
VKLIKIQIVKKEKFEQLPNRNKIENPDNKRKDEKRKDEVNHEENSMRFKM